MLRKKFEERFSNLSKELSDLRLGAKEVENPYSRVVFPNTQQTHFQLGSNLLTKWMLKAEFLISELCGEKSLFLTEFRKLNKSIIDPFRTLQCLEAVFLAVKEEFEAGNLNSLKSLVQAEVFKSELEQAEELLQSGYATAAAVIAGVVLETALRDLCSINGIEHGSINKMNDDLAKTGAYNANQKKQITSLSAIRNSAAHGKPEEFTKDQVKGMIDDVQRFLVAYF